MTRKVRFEQAALRDLERLSKKVQRRILARIEMLADDPVGPASKPLQGNLRGLRCARVGEWRITYVVEAPDGLLNRGSLS